MKDANTAVQALATALDGNGSLVPVHVPAASNAQGVADAGRAAKPAAGRQYRRRRRQATAAARSRPAARAQMLFGGIVPENGFLVQNNSSAALWISDVGTASAGGASIQIAANGGIFVTPSGYKPAGAVSLYGATTGQAFAARRW